MTSNITSILEDDNGNICLHENADGELTLSFAHDHRVISQLFRSTLTTQLGSIGYAPSIGIDWAEYRQSDSDLSFLPVEINALGLGIDGIKSVDLSDAKYQHTETTIDIIGICFTTDCLNSQNYQTVNI